MDINQDRISFKDMLDFVIDYMKYFWKGWWLFCLLIAISITISLIFVYDGKLYYVANYTFTVNEGVVQGGGIGSILGSIGVGGSAGSINSFKVIKISRSRAILSQVLKGGVQLQDSLLIVGDLLLDEYNLKEEWGDSREWTGSFTFLNDSIDEVVYNSILKRTVGVLRGSQSVEGLTSLNYEDQSNVFTLSVKTTNPLLSYEICNKMYDELSSYYVNLSIEGKVRSFDKLESKSDSLLARIKVVEEQLARLEDKNRTIVLRKNKTSIDRLNREFITLNTVYSEVVRNKETTDFLIASEQPYFKAIDPPIRPLPIVKSNIIKLIAIASALGIFATALLLGGWKHVRGGHN